MLIPQRRLSVFAQLSLTNCRDIISSLKSNEAEYNRQMYDGDHWLSGAGWIGPQPKAGDAEYAEIFSKIRRAFVSQNVVREIARRHRNGLVGREPLYGVTPKVNIDKYKKARGLRASDPPPRMAALNRFIRDTTQSENPDPELVGPAHDQLSALAQEVEDALDEWFDKRECHNVVRAAVISLMLECRASFRLFVPPGKLQEVVGADGRITKGIKAKTLSEALDYIYLQHPSTSQATVVTDPQSMERGSIYLHKELSGDNQAEVMVRNMGTVQALQMTMSGQTVSPQAGNNPDLLPTVLNTNAPDALSARDAADGWGRSFGGDVANVAEITFVEKNNDKAETVFRVIHEDGRTQEARFEMGGRLPVYEMQSDPLITTQIRQNQFQLNRSLTMMGHNVDLAGFLERVVFNAEQPVNSGDAGDEDEDTDTVRVPNYIKIGSGYTTFLNGISYTDEAGNIKIANPSIVYRDPVSPEPLIAAIKRSYQNMLQEAQQMHVLISGDVPVSGEARRQAMADFVMSLLESRPVVEAALRWVIETALSLAAAFLGTPGKYDELRAVADVRMEASPLMAEDMRMILGAVAQRLMSKESAMIRFGIEDPEAERQRILEDLADMMAHPLMSPVQNDPGGMGSDLAGNDPNPQQSNPSSTPTAGTQ